MQTLGMPTSWGGVITAPAGPRSHEVSPEQAQLEAQRATQDFQRATEVLRAAKETISLAEQRLLEDDKRQFDSAWQEMLNHATQRVRVSVGVPVCTHLRVGWQGEGRVAGKRLGLPPPGVPASLGCVCLSDSRFPAGFPEQSKQACCTSTGGHLQGGSPRAWN